MCTSVKNIGQVWSGRLDSKNGQQQRGKSNAGVQRHRMYEKNGKYYADWRTADRVRHRKQFPTALGAKRYETKQKALAPPVAQSAGAVPPSPKPRASTTSRSSSAGLPPKLISRTSVSTTSKKQKRLGRTSAARQSTPTLADSAASSRPWRQRERQPSASSSSALHLAHRVPSGRPKTKRVGVSPLPILASAGCSPAHSTLVSATKPHLL